MVKHNSQRIVRVNLTILWGWHSELRFFLVYVSPFFRALSIMRVMLQMLNILLIISHLTHHQHQNNIYSHSILLLADFRQKFVDWIWTIVYSAVPSDFFGP